MGLAAEETALTFKEKKPNKTKSIVIDPSPDTVSIVDINSKVLINVIKRRLHMTAAPGIQKLIIRKIPRTSSRQGRTIAVRFISLSGRI